MDQEIESHQNTAFFRLAYSWQTGPGFLFNRATEVKTFGFAVVCAPSCCHSLMFSSLPFNQYSATHSKRSQFRAAGRICSPPSLHHSVYPWMEPDQQRAKL